MTLSFNNKRQRGDIPSIIYFVVAIFVVGVIIFMASHVNLQIYQSLDKQLASNPTTNNTQALTSLQTIEATEGGHIWDYAFLGIFLGILLVLGLTGYSVRISPVFYWVYGVLSMLVLLIGVLLSNTWQAMAADPQFTATVARFPIMNFVLGTYYPTIVLGAVILVMILLFSKSADSGGIMQ